MADTDYDIFLFNDERILFRGTSGSRVFKGRGELFTSETMSHYDPGGTKFQAPGSPTDHDVLVELKVAMGNDGSYPFKIRAAQAWRIDDWDLLRDGVDLDDVCKHSCELNRSQATSLEKYVTRNYEPFQWQNSLGILRSGGISW